MNQQQGQQKPEVLDNYFRPSNVGRSLLCSGWIGLCKYIKAGPSDVVAEMGIGMHGWMKRIGEHWKNSGKKINPEELTLWAVSEGLDEDDSNLIAYCLGYLQGTLEKIDPIEPDFEILFELPIELIIGDNVAGYTKIFPHGGTADVVIFTNDKAIIIDWKFGWNPLKDANIAGQLAGYFCGVHQKRYLKEYEVHAVMPRIDEKYKKSFFSSDFAMWTRRLDTIKEKTEEKEWWKGLNPSPTACEHCPGKHRCHAFGGTITDVAAASQYVEKLTADQMEHLKSFETVIKDVYKVIRQRMIDLDSHGYEFKNYKIKSENGNRYITHIPTFAHNIREYLTPHQVMENCSVKLSIIDTAAKQLQKEKGGTFKDAKEEIIKLAGKTIRRQENIIKIRRKKS